MELLASMWGGGGVHILVLHSLTICLVLDI